VWFLQLWVRHERRVAYEWVLLNDNPTTSQHLYELEIAHDDSTSDDQWIMMLYVDGEFKEELRGLLLPKELSVKIRNWNYDVYVPPITDPFNPFRTESVISAVRVPVPQVRMNSGGRLKMYVAIQFHHRYLADIFRLESIQP
jgi:hypothetical protein